MWLNVTDDNDKTRPSFRSVVRVFALYWALKLSDTDDKVDTPASKKVHFVDKIIDLVDDTIWPYTLLRPFT